MMEKMCRNYNIYSILCILISVVYAHNFRDLDDSMIFKINWSEKSREHLLVSILLTE